MPLLLRDARSDGAAAVECQRGCDGVTFEGRDPPVTPALRLVVNGREHAVEAAPATSLLMVLRNDIGLNGPKYGCGLGECGACAVLISDRAVRACRVSAAAAAGHPVTTLEGLGTIDAPHPVQAAFIVENAAQCGYCLNGMIIATTALLAANPHPTETDLREALRHNLCRCGAHLEILAAARRAIRLMGIPAAHGRLP